MTKTYTIGTRDSLLARTQTTILKNELEKLSQGISFEIKTFKTQGDLQTEKPLWQIDGKDFFTKELDEKLIKNDVDMVVHSYKDLGSVRPDGIKLACITERIFPEDILLIKKNTVNKLLSNSFEGKFRIGTSSPRRIQNLSYINDYLSFDSLNKENLEISMLRGNVNTRIQKLLDDNYDAIVLAYAGLERLASLEESKKVLISLLNELNFFIFPSSVFPGSASQGALAVEVSEKHCDHQLKSILSQLHDSQTAKEVELERKIFNQYGGGCHLAVGINVKSIKNKFLVYERGSHKDQEIYKNFSHEKYPKLNTNINKVFIGLPESKLESVLKNHQKLNKNDFLSDEFINKKIEFTLNKNKYSGHLFFTSSYTLEETKNCNLEKSFVWVSGNQTLKKISSLNIWPNGSSDSLGRPFLERYINSNLMKVFNKNVESEDKSLKHYLFSYKRASGEDNKFELVKSYSHEISNLNDEFVKNFKETKLFYWTSFRQYKMYVDQFPFLKENKNITHCCGFGKTLNQFIESDIDVISFMSLKEFVEFSSNLSGGIVSKN